MHGPVSEMTVKQLKEELAARGCSAEGCCERAEIETRLLEARRAQGAHDSGVQEGQESATPAGAPPGTPGMEQFMASMTASFNNMGDSFGLMVSTRVVEEMIQVTTLRTGLLQEVHRSDGVRSMVVCSTSGSRLEMGTDLSCAQPCR